MCSQAAIVSIEKVFSKWMDGVACIANADIPIYIRFQAMARNIRVAQIW